jgi:hypothetical protein
MNFDAATPEVIAEAVSEEVGRKVDYEDVETGCAAHAARQIAELN